MAADQGTSNQISLTNYIAYRDPDSGSLRVGHYDLSQRTIQPLSFASGARIENIYQVIEAGESNIIASTSSPIPASSVKVLPPLTGRDVLCVGKNYSEHAKEFNTSGFDSSDKVDQPSHPVIFTKRFTSIVADGEEIYPHAEFTQTIDYEGEIGVIIGKPAFRVSQEDAMNYVWGYTIVNDVTARERQRDHKQFYIGKSPDTFCPMGPIAVPASRLDKTLRIQTHVNGELRQNATTNDLIFSIPYLIQTMSEGQTLMPGDVLATGTPAGVGIGRKPPTYLKPKDTVAISVTGLGTLTNQISDSTSPNLITSQVENMSHLRPYNTARAIDSASLTRINGKPLHYKTLGNKSDPPIVFVHGLAGSTESFAPLIHALKLEASHSLHLFDLEGLGLSPTSPLSKISIASLAADLNGVFEHANITSGATLVAHSLGTLAAVKFAITHPDKISKLVLFDPPPSPFPGAAVKAACARADMVRTKGMTAIVDGMTAAVTSEKTRTENPVAVAAVRMALLSQDPEGYAKASVAAVGSEGLDFAKIQARTLIITGSADQVSPPQLCEKYVGSLGDRASLKVLEDVGHWPVFEDLKGVVAVFGDFLK